MDKIPPFDYLKGEAFTDKLKEVTGCKTLLEMSERFDIPKATFSAWNTHERTSHELMVRLHLAIGVPIEELALNETDKQKLTQITHFKPKNPHLGDLPNNMLFLSDRANRVKVTTVELTSFCLTNGKLLDTGKVPYPVSRINGFGLENADLIEIETNQSVVLVDKKENDAMNGNYLIAIDGRYSINQVQRLPGKLAIAFDGQTIEVQDGDIEVIGKVVLETKLK